MNFISVLLLCLSLLSVSPLRAADNDDDVYQEDAIKPFLDTLPEAGDEEKEQPLVLPPYPHEENLIEVDSARYGFPYRLFVDSASLSVGEDRVVRYTAVLRSDSGVDNVSFEGIRCVRRQFKRYAYGSVGQFYPLANNDWQYIRQTRQDIFRKLLADDYFCPLPVGDQAAELVKRLKHSVDYAVPGDME